MVRSSIIRWRKLVIAGLSGEWGKHGLVTTRIPHLTGGLLCLWSAHATPSDPFTVVHANNPNTPRLSYRGAV